jgi:hypothetical protein
MIPGHAAIGRGGAQGEGVLREAYLVQRKEPIAYGLWQEPEWELPKLRIDFSSRQTALFPTHQL